MKSGTIILAAAIIILFSFECGAQWVPKSTAPAPRGKTGDSVTPTANPKTTGSRVAPSVGIVINTQTLTITGAPSASQPFSPLMISTATLTITGAATDGKFSPVNINTQALTITGISGGK